MSYDAGRNDVWVAAQAEIDSLTDQVRRWKSGADYMERERNRCRVECRKAHDMLDDQNYWAFEAGVDNHLQSLVCQVLIDAHDLQEIVARAEAAEAQVARMRETLKAGWEKAEHLYWHVPGTMAHTGVGDLAELLHDALDAKEPT